MPFIVVNFAAAIIESLTIQPMEHVGIVVDDLGGAIKFFVQLGLSLQGEAPVEGRWVDRIVGLDGVRADIAMLHTPDGNGRLELTNFHTPPSPQGDEHAPANTPGISHVAFLVEDIDAVVAGLRARGTELVGELVRYKDSYWLCYAFADRQIARRRLLGDSSGKGRSRRTSVRILA